MISFIFVILSSYVGCGPGFHTLKKLRSKCWWLCARWSEQGSRWAPCATHDVRKFRALKVESFVYFCTRLRNLGSVGMFGVHCLHLRPRSFIKNSLKMAKCYFGKNILRLFIWKAPLTSPGQIHIKLNFSLFNTEYV